jgi:hypothetical protein
MSPQKIMYLGDSATIFQHSQKLQLHIERLA